MKKVSSQVVAHDLGVSERSVRAYAQAGRIPFTITPGGHRRFDLVDVRKALGITIHREPPTLAMLHARRAEIIACAGQHGATHVRVFGSVAGDTASATSDVDLLVSLERGRTYADVDELEDELEELLGYHVDVLTDGACHGRFAAVPGESVAL